MADESKSDMVMKFVQNGDAVSAECVLDKDPNDKFMADFNPATYQDYSDFFEVLKFDFTFTVHEQDTSISGTSKTSQAHHPSAKANPKSKIEFASWRNAKDSQVAAFGYPIEFDKFTFSRMIDAASPIFFQACTNGKSFDSAALVKRVSVGQVGGGSSLLNLSANLGPLSLNLQAGSGQSRPAVGFLRIDFLNVLITSIDWDDGDVMTENCSFICKDFKVQYRQQEESGALQSAVSSAHWNQAMNPTSKQGGR